MRDRHEKGVTGRNNMDAEWMENTLYAPGMEYWYEKQHGLIS